MARALLRIRVELESGMGETFEPPPGRDLLVGPSHTFAALVDAIEEPGVEDDAAVKSADAVAPRDEGGPAPRTPVPIFGWGWIPDQYGRETEDGDE